MAMLKKALLTKASYSNEANDREKRNLKVAYDAAVESIVLLKNDNESLPLKNNKVAMYGNGVTMTIKGGTGSGEVNERHSVTIFEGFENRGFEITNKALNLKYIDLYYEREREFIKEQKKMMYKHPTKIMTSLFAPFMPPEFEGITDDEIATNETPNCIYVLSRQAGEGKDRRAEKGDMFVTDSEKADIAKLAAAYDNFILIINTGSQMDMAFIDDIEGIDSILYICELGTEGGNAVADIVAGKATPSGKLADTWAVKYADVPFGDEFSYLDGDVTKEAYKEGIYVGYRYFDTFKKEVRYPFGYGLSYTDFKIQNVEVSNNKSKLLLKVDVKNDGDFKGKEVVQVYITPPVGNIDKEYQALAGFAKTKELGVNETESLIIEVNLEDIASFDEKRASYILEAGNYIVRVGNSSRKTKAYANVVIEKEIVVSKHDNILPKNEIFEELISKREESDVDGLPVVTLTREDFETKVHEYPKMEEVKDKRVQEMMSKLTIKNMAHLCVGAGMFGGENRFNLPGSVGNTTSDFWDLGLANVPMCDGPAGLRIQRTSGVTKDGKVKPVDSVLGAMALVMPEFIKKRMNADLTKDTPLYQFTTAFPVAAALAQTWNRDMLYTIGKAVYEEMKEYGCTYWLAPALNIHRNPLCGRNFEYFSEDPFLTGKLVASMVKGVQQEDGYYVTIKHYACNNQEENRNNVSSNISERALREIYLKGFRFAVEEGKAKSVMSAYNMINGVYCGNSYDLCTKVLRNEWGFDGVVMTDWFASMMGKEDDALCMSAGNDLVMPGGKSFEKKILKGLKKGKIEEKDIRICASRIIKSILDSAIQKEYIDNNTNDLK